MRRTRLITGMLVTAGMGALASAPAAMAGDALVTLSTTAPTGTPTVIKPGSIDYTADLTRGGDTNQVTKVDLCLVAEAALGTIAGPCTKVTFGPGNTGLTGTVAVSVPAAASNGVATYHFTASYDPNGTDGVPIVQASGTATSFVIDGDGDGDGVADGIDNCVASANAGQVDTDADGIGDVCDPNGPNNGKLGGAPSVDAAATHCPAGKAATGVTGKRGQIGPTPGNVVGSATMLCQDGATAIGTIGAGPVPGDLVGTTSCDPGQVAVGIQGREGDFIDQLSVRCQAADLTGPITTAAGYGGVPPGGGTDGPYDCPAGQRLIGLDGSTSFIGTVARHVAIQCAAGASLTPPAPLPPATPIASPTIAPGPTGQRTAAMKKCAKIKSQAKKKKCRKRAKSLPA